LLLDFAISRILLHTISMLETSEGMMPSWRGSRLKLNELLVRSTDRLLAASLALALAAHGYIGLFARYMADDYNTWRVVHARGFLNAQVHWYLDWTGRFSFSLVVSLCSLIGPRIVPFLPALLLASWVAALVWAVRQMAWPGALKSSYMEALLCAGLVIFATLKIAPDVVQSLYWQAGALSYITPLILFSFYLGLLSYSLRGATAHAARPSTLRLCSAAIVTFAAGGCSDAYVVLQTSALFLAVIVGARYAPAKLKSALRALLVAGLVGSLLALVVVALAPGNAVRQAYFPPPPGLFRILTLSALYTLGFAALSVFRQPLVFVLLLLWPFLTALKRPGRGAAAAEDAMKRAWLLVLIPIAVFALNVSCIAPALYGTSNMLPRRAQVLLSFTLVCGAAVWGRAAGEYAALALPFISQNAERLVRPGSILLLLLMLACPVASCVSTLALRERARAYAADWDRQDKELRTAKDSGVQELTVEQIGDFQSRLGLRRSELHLQTDPNFWINQAVAKYYGLRSVAAREDAANLR
jgi:Family of unknown function (DUF6056)